MKLIAIDLDGTLLNSQGTISSNNIQAIRQVMENYHIVAIATGRTHFGVRSLLQSRLTLPVIASNGATIHAQEDSLIDETVLDRQTAKKIIGYLLEQHMYFEITTDQQLLIPSYGEQELKSELEQLKKKTPNLDENALWQKALNQFAQAGISLLNNLKTLLNSPTPIYKILTFSYNPDLLLQTMTHFASDSSVRLTSSSSPVIEFISPKIDKGAGVLTLAHQYHIHREDIIVIGDNLNDLSMFQIAHTKVAMMNASSDLKKISTYITRSNNEDGVAFTLTCQLGLVK